MLSEMVAEAQELKTAAGGSVTDAVAAWLAPQYLLAAREKLEAIEGSGRLEVLRTILHNWTARNWNGSGPIANRKRKRSFANGFSARKSAGNFSRKLRAALAGKP
jgi:hypothetical protein